MFVPILVFFLLLTPELVCPSSPPHPLLRFLPAHPLPISSSKNLRRVSRRLPPSPSVVRCRPSLAVSLSVSIHFSYSFLYVSLHALSSVLAAPPTHWCACACPWGGRRGVPPRANRTHTTGAYISGQCSVCTRVWCSVRVCVCVCVCVVQCIILNCGGILWVFTVVCDFGGTMYQCTSTLNILCASLFLFVPLYPPLLHLYPLSPSSPLFPPLPTPPHPFPPQERHLRHHTGCWTTYRD